MNLPNFTFSGPIGSGKTSVSKRFAAALGYGWNGFGSTVKRIAVERSVPIERTALQALGAELIAADPDGFCARVFKEAQPPDATSVVIDGLRHARIKEVLERLSAPRPLFCIYVDTSNSVRLDRLAERDGLSAEQILTLEAHSTEIEVTSVVRRVADFVVDNSGDLENTLDQILAWTSTLNAKR
jgi:dephospho-CoA kinase